MKKRHTVSFWLKTTIKIMVVALLFIAMFSYAMFQGGFVSWFLFYSTSLLVVLMLLYAIIPLGSFQVIREMGDHAVVANSTIHVTVTIKRKWPFPFLYLLVKDHLDESLKGQIASGHYKTIFYPSFKRELTYSYEIPTIRRGEYQFYGIHVETSDMFGLFHKRKYIVKEDTLLAYPNHYSIEKWSPYEKRETETRLSTFDFIEELTSVSGSREYVPGDKLTTIDWKVTARSSKLMTKEFEQYLGQNFLVILNNHLRDSSDNSYESFEAAVELVTSIVMHANLKQLDLGLWTVGETTEVFPIDSGSQHQKRLIRYLAKIQGKTENGFSLPLKELEVKNLFEMTVVFVSTEVSVEIVECLRTYASRRMKVFFCLIDKDASINTLEDKQLEEIRRYGVTTYLLCEGNIDLAIPSHVG